MDQLKITHQEDWIKIRQKNLPPPILPIPEHKEKPWLVIRELGPSITTKTRIIIKEDSIRTPDYPSSSPPPSKTRLYL